MQEENNGSSPTVTAGRLLGGALNGPVGDGTGDAEEFREFGRGRSHIPMPANDIVSWAQERFGCFPRSLSLALATATPSLVLARIRWLRTQQQCLGH